MDTLWRDVRYGARMLARSPGVTLIAVLTLALGIGVNTAVFSAVNGILLAPLPYPQARQLVRLYETRPSEGWDEVDPSLANATDWQQQSHLLESVALFNWDRFNLTTGGDPIRVSGAQVTPAMFQVLGAKPALGRAFRPEETRAGGPQVALLSHGLWERRFGADPGVLSQTVVLNQENYLIVGVMPADFSFFYEPVDIWTPLQIDPSKETRNHRWIDALGRMKPGATLPALQAELDTIAQRLEKEYPNTNSGWGVRAVSLYDVVFDDTLRTILTTMLLGVTFVLLIACVNVANLLLARAATREREVAIRMAIGAGRWHLIRQLLTESVMLALLGGSAGILVALWGVEALLGLAPEDVPRLDHVGLDGHVLLYTLGVSLFTGLLFGLAPAWQATKPDLNESLKEGARSSLGSSHHRLLKTLVVSEVTLALVLLVAGGLMVRSFHLMQQEPLGFKTGNLLTLRLDLPETGYPEESQRAAFYREVLERVQTTGGVESAAIVNTIPMGGNNTWVQVSVEGRPPAETSEREYVGYMVISPDYPRTLGIPLTAGRTFSAQDSLGAPRAVLINQTMARRYWGQDDPLGKRFKFGAMDSDNPWLTVVGVLGDVRHRNVSQPVRPELYLPHSQTPSSAMTLLARTTGDPLDRVAAVREQVWAVDANQPVYSVQTMEQIVLDRWAGPRAGARIFGFLAVAALVLAAVGIYGVISYAVAERTRELGLRMALGAGPREIFALVLRQGLFPVLIGLVLGLMGALGSMRVLASLLFGVTPTDPTTLLGTMVVLGGVALLACYLPARRATRVDPMVALRYE